MADQYIDFGAVGVRQRKHSKLADNTYKDVVHEITPKLMSESNVAYNMCA